MSMSECKYENLTAKQRKLIDGLMSGLSKAEAYRRAYPNTNIVNPTDQVNCMIENRNGKFRKFSVVYAEMESEAIKRIEAEKENSIASRIDVMLFFTKVMNGEIEDSVLRFVGDGVQVADKIDPMLKDRLNAAEKLGKYHAIFTDRAKVENSGVVQIVDDIK